MIKIRNKLGIIEIHILYVVPPTFVPDYIGNIIPTLPYPYDTEGFSEDKIYYAFQTQPRYSENNAMVIKLMFHLFQGKNHMIRVKTFVMKRNGRWYLLDLEKHKMRSSKWDTIIEKAEYVVCNQVYNARNLRYLLPNHINSHHNAQGDLTRYADHIPYGFPN